MEAPNENLDLMNTVWRVIGIWGWYFDRNVPWAQQAEKKSLNVGYKNQTIIFKIYRHFDQISYVTEFWQLLYLASLVLFCFASIVTSYDNFKNSEMFLKPSVTRSYYFKNSVWILFQAQIIIYLKAKCLTLVANI